MADATVPAHKQLAACSAVFRGMLEAADKHNHVAILHQAVGGLVNAAPFTNEETTKEAGELMLFLHTLFALEGVDAEQEHKKPLVRSLREKIAARIVSLEKLPHSGTPSEDAIKRVAHALRRTFTASCVVLAVGTLKKIKETPGSTLEDIRTVYILEDMTLTIKALALKYTCTREGEACNQDLRAIVCHMLSLVATLTYSRVVAAAGLTMSRPLDMEDVWTRACTRFGSRELQENCTATPEGAPAITRRRT